MKIARHAEILKIIKENEVETQSELAELLKEAGFSATQATVSRDIRALRLVKSLRNSGKACYEAPQDNQVQPEKYIRVLKGTILSVVQAKNLVIVRTVPGMAMAAAAALDGWENEKIAGCIAGDDTIFCAAFTDEEAAIILEDINKLLS